jgi:hypothetical protein
MGGLDFERSGAAVDPSGPDVVSSFLLVVIFSLVGSSIAVDPPLNRRIRWQKWTCVRSKFSHCVACDWAATAAV